MVAKIDPGTAAGQQDSVATPLKCPRCDSANTKFCYYNNYSLSQPRHFCKSCKRYWTRGGTLRNVPVGGGSRKNKRAKKHRRSPETSMAPSLPPPPIIHVTHTDFNSLLYGLPAINTSTVSLPKFDLDAPLAGYEGKYFQTFLGANLPDLQKLAAGPKIFLGDYSLLTSQVPSSSSAAACAGAAGGYQPLISFDEFPIETPENNTSHKSIHCQFIKGDNDPAESINSFAGSGPGAAAADSSYVYWNQAASGGWPESGSSMAPLF